MTDPLSSPAPAPLPAEAAPTGGGFFQNLIDVYFSPREAFTRIVRRPAFVLPLLGHLILTAAFTGYWLNKIEPREFMKTQLEESGQWDKMQPEQRNAIVENAGAQMKIFGWIGTVFVPIIVLVVAAVLMFIYRFFYSSEVGFKQSFAIVTWVFFAVAVISTPLLLAVFHLKGDWNLNPQEVIQANLGVFLDKATTAKPLWALLTSLDLFVVWMLYLLATGFGVASRKPLSSAIWGVAVPWAIIVVIKVAWAAVF
jgi:hypothetical protein